MQDRFKFRVWSKANNKYCHHITTDLSADGLLRVLRPLEKSEYIDDWEHQYDIQQCTGLKDKNGKLIYEGDIVKINENYCDWSAIDDFYRKQNFVVEYFEANARFLIKAFKFLDNSGNGVYDLSPDWYEFLKWKPCGKLEEYTLCGVEVIGNIYEDSHLIGGVNERS